MIHIQFDQWTSLHSLVFLRRTSFSFLYDFLRLPQYQSTINRSLPTSSISFAEMTSFSFLSFIFLPFAPISVNFIQYFLFPSLYIYISLTLSPPSTNHQRYRESKTSQVFQLTQHTFRSIHTSIEYKAIDTTVSMKESIISGRERLIIDVCI